MQDQYTIVQYIYIGYTLGPRYIRKFKNPRARLQCPERSEGTTMARGFLNLRMYRRTQCITCLVQSDLRAQTVRVCFHGTKIQISRSQRQHRYYTSRRQEKLNYVYTCSKKRTTYHAPRLPRTVRTFQELGSAHFTTFASARAYDSTRTRMHTWPVFINMYYTKI